MDGGLILKIRRGEPFTMSDLDLFRSACIAFLDDGVPIEKTLRLTKSDRTEERNRRLLELGRILSPHGGSRLQAREAYRAIGVFQRSKWKNNKGKTAPPPDFSKGECLLFWAHKILDKMPDERQLTNIFEKAISTKSVTY
jgi:hypothetical protein